MKLDDMNAKDERIADLYATGATVAQIAAEIGSSVTTVYRKLRDPLIKARIADQQGARLRPLIRVIEEQIKLNLFFYAGVRDTTDGTVAMRDRIAAAGRIDTLFGPIRDAGSVSQDVADLHAQVSELTGDGSN